MTKKEEGDTKKGGGVRLKEEEKKERKKALHIARCGVSGLLTGWPFLLESRHTHTKYLPNLDLHAHQFSGHRVSRRPETSTFSKLGNRLFPALSLPQCQRTAASLVRQSPCNRDSLIPVRQGSRNIEQRQNACTRSAPREPSGALPGSTPMLLPRNQLDMPSGPPC